jgi:ABC-type uncharacterized transport system permease subunit
MVFLAFAATICVAIVASLIASYLRPAEATSDVVRGKMFDLITFIVGVVSGWLGKPEQMEEGKTKQ